MLCYYLKKIIEDSHPYVKKIENGSSPSPSITSCGSPLGATIYTEEEVIKLFTNIKNIKEHIEVLAVEFYNVPLPVNLSIGFGIQGD